MPIENSLPTTSTNEVQIIPDQINLSDNFQNAEKTEPLNLPITNNPLPSNQIQTIKPKKTYKYMFKAGRKSIYNPILAEFICKRIIQGESLFSISKDKRLPSLDTIYSWLRTNKEFSEMYEKAKSDQIDTFADQIIDISDNSKEDFIEIKNEKGEIVRVNNSEHVQRSRLRVDARKWVAERMKPRKYGVSQTPSVNVAVQVNNNITIELDDRINQLLKDRENKPNEQGNNDQ